MANAKPKEQEKDESNLRNSLFAKAQTILKSRHPEEFEEIVVGLYEENGLERRRRRTAEEKAAADLAEMREKYPHLFEDGK